MKLVKAKFRGWSDREDALSFPVAENSTVEVAVDDTNSIDGCRTNR